MNDTTNNSVRPGWSQHLPFVRVVATPFIRVLAALPVTPNQLTALSLILGLWAAWLFYLGGMQNNIIAAGLFTISYVLDNCDGAIARMKGLESDFGMRFDTFADWLVNACFFICLGWGETVRSGDDIWLWCGIAAAFGGTMNYIIDQFRDTKEKAEGLEKVHDGPDERVGDQTVYLSRVLRSDFCFIVIALVVFDLVWVLLPAAAIGAQVYWGLQFTKGFRRHHV